MADFSLPDLIAARDAASAAYYAGEESPLTDEQFDELTAQLAELGVDETVGHGFTPSQKIAHRTPMLSLAKVRTVDEVRRFVDRTAADVYLLEAKYDGLAASVIYRAVGTHDLATFDRAVSRGDGIHGEDISAAIKAMIDAGQLPQDIHAPNAEGEVEVRGEILFTAEGFAAVNASGKYANARNAAAGIVRRSDNAAEQQHLSFVVHNSFDLDDPEGFTITVDHFARHVPTEGRTVDSVTVDIMAAIAEFDAHRATLPFDTDGVVIKTNRSARARLGEGSTSPNWAVAFKFASEVATATLTDVRWQLGRSGKLTPVAVFTPVSLAGATVTQATLHNIGFIDDLNLQIGDELTVTRSGEVIPYVLAARPTSGSRPIEQPREWAGRDGVTYPVVRDGVNLRVDGYLDPVPNIVYGLRTLGALGVAESLVTKLVNAGLATDIVDLTDVTAADIESLDGHGAVSATNAVAAIRKAATDATVGRWFATLGLPGLGRTIGKTLEKQFCSLDGIANASADDLHGLDGMGPISIATLLGGQGRVRVLAERLAERGLTPASAAETPQVASAIAGLNVVITGTIPGFTRDGAAAAAEKLGAIVRSSVSKSTDLLIVGAGGGGKADKAAALGIEIMPAEEFVALAG